MSEFLVDSTVWIEFFKGKHINIISFISPLIEEDRIYYNGIILSELLIGASNSKEFSFLQSNFEGFRHLDADKIIFEKAAQFGFQLRRKGITVPLTDLIIAAHAIKHSLILVTSDPHFKLLQKHLKLNLEFFSQGKR
jgi:predicted nucleic acid-binding protein